MARVKRVTPSGGATLPRTLPEFATEVAALLHSHGVPARAAKTTVLRHCADVKRAWQNGQPPCAPTDTILQEERAGMHGKPTLTRKRAKRDPVPNAPNIIEVFLTVLTSKLTQYDVKQSKTRFYNPNALGLYMQRVQVMREELAGPGADIYSFRGALTNEFDRNFPPVKNVLKQVNEYITAGKMPSIVRGRI